MTAKQDQIKLEIRETEDGGHYSLFYDNYDLTSNFVLLGTRGRHCERLIAECVSLESQVEKAAELKEAVEFIEDKNLQQSRTALSNYRDKRYSVFSDSMHTKDYGHGDSIPAAVTDYREKNDPQPGRLEEAEGLLQEALDDINGNRADLYPRPAVAKKIDRFLGGRDD